MALQHARRCNAQSKRTQQRCQNPAVRNGEKCRHHGGKSPKGVQSPHFKTGKFSKYLPINLLGLFAEILSDTELFELNSEAGLLDLQVAQLLNKLEDADDTEQEKIWARINRLIPQKVRLAEAQTKRLILHHQYIPSDAVFRMVDALVESVRVNVSDQRTLAAFHSRLKEFVSQERAAELMR